MRAITKLSIKNLTLLDDNPRTITRDEMLSLCKSIQDDSDFLELRPILVNSVEGKLTVYAGNQRVRAAKKLGMKEIPCIVEENLQSSTMRQRLLKDNRSWGEFDWDILGNSWEVSELFDAGFTDRELHLDSFDIKDVISEEKEEKKNKEKLCPHCGKEI